MNARRKQITPKKLNLPRGDCTEVIVNCHIPDMASAVGSAILESQGGTRKRSKKSSLIAKKQSSQKSLKQGSSKQVMEEEIEIRVESLSRDGGFISQSEMMVSLLNDVNSKEKTSELENSVKGHFFHKIQSPCLEESENVEQNVNGHTKNPRTRVNPKMKPKMLTDFYPIRRSNRKTKHELQAEQNEKIKSAIMSEVDEGLEIKYFPEKGRGIVAKKSFKKGDFIVEYAGDLIDINAARKREKFYSSDQKLGCYMYYFIHKDQHYCIDATKEDGRLGRLVNHSRYNYNLITKTFEVKDKPHLILIANCNINPGEEILYDYGDRSKQSLVHHPWLAS